MKTYLFHYYALQTGQLVKISTNDNLPLAHMRVIDSEPDMPWILSFTQCAWPDEMEEISHAVTNMEMFQEKGVVMWEDEEYD